MTSRALIIASTLLATSAGAQDFGQNRLCQGMGPPPSTEWGPPGPPGGRGPQGPPPVVEPPFLLDRLDLDPRTREQMERIRAEADETTESIQARVAEELDRLQELMEEEPFDRDAILAQAAIVEDLRKEKVTSLEAVLAGLVKARRLKEAYQATVDETKRESAKANGWIARANMALELGLLDDARKALRRARKLDPLVDVPEMLKK